MRKLYLLLMMLWLVLMLTGCSCKHDETTIINVQEPTCEVVGYSGDIQCVKCSEILQKGENISASGHQPGNLIDVQAADCTHDGYTGNRLCTVCGELVETGVMIQKFAHTASQPQGVKAASCTEEGYSGDAYCIYCDEMLRQGEVIAVLAHTPGEPEGIVEPSCSSQGFTGNILCSVCGVQLEQGQKIQSLGHAYSNPIQTIEATCTSEGYTGDQICVRCSFVQQGEVIPRLPHSYEDHACKACGWPEAGLYDMQGQMVYTWQQLVDKKILLISKSTMNGMQVSLVKAKDKTLLAGTLVISDQDNSRNTNVHIAMSSFEKCESLAAVYLPTYLTKIPNRAFSNSGLEQIHFSNSITVIDVGAFSSCASLKSFDVPEGITDIYGAAFADCIALESVTLPSTIKTIGQGAFENDTRLTELLFPEGLEALSSRSFKNTGLREIVLPSTVTTLDHTGTGGQGPFSYCAQLTKLDLSLTQIKSLIGSQFTGCTSLEELLLPRSLTEMNAVSLNGTKLSELRLPQGFKKLFLGYYDKLDWNIKTIYWPISFVDTEQVFANYHFDKVYFEGTQAQWEAFAPKGLDVTEIVYSYVYE